MPTLTTAARADRRQRIAGLLEAVMPALHAYGLPFGMGGRRLVAPPWNVTLRADRPDAIEISVGKRRFLIAHLEGQSVYVRYCARGDWDADLLCALPARPSGQ